MATWWMREPKNLGVVSFLAVLALLVTGGRASSPLTHAERLLVQQRAEQGGKMHAVSIMSIMHLISQCMPCSQLLGLGQVKQAVEQP